jgi:hypothetical protein
MELLLTEGRSLAETDKHLSRLRNSAWSTREITGMSLAMALLLRQRTR